MQAGMIMIYSLCCGIQKTASFPYGILPQWNQYAGGTAPFRHIDAYMRATGVLMWMATKQWNIQPMQKKWWHSYSSELKHIPATLSRISCQALELPIDDAVLLWWLRSWNEWWRGIFEKGRNCIIVFWKKSKFMRGKLASGTFRLPAIPSKRTPENDTAKEIAGNTPGCPQEVKGWSN